MDNSIQKGTGNSRYLKSIPDFLAKYPTYESMVAALVAGKLPVDFNGINPEGWVKVGTALDKENLLADPTCDLLGILRTSTVNDAFVQLSLGQGKYGYVITVFDFDGDPVPGITVSGVSSLPGKTLVTDKNGMVIGTSPYKSVTITANSPYWDMKSGSVSVAASGALTVCNVTLGKAQTSQYTLITSSTSIKLSPKVKSVDLTAVGGGGGGAKSSAQYAPGGAGGFVETVKKYPVPQNDRTLVIQVGSGGIPGDNYTPGGTGGATNVTNNKKTVVNARGGSGSKDTQAADGCGVGGPNSVPPNGGNCGKRIFDDPSLALAGSGGGGSMLLVSGSSGGWDIYKGRGGSPNGGSANRDATAQSGTVPGGGGGGSNTEPGKGADGGLYIRVNY